MFVSGCDAELVAGNLIELWEDQMQDVAAAFELIRGDRRKRKKDGDRSQHSRRGVVTRFQKIGNSKLRELTGSRGNKDDHQQSYPASRGLPECGEAVLERVLGAAEQAARADPG